MRDSNNKIRFKCGLDKTDNKFKFVLCDKDEQPTIYMDDNGDVIFAGKVDTGKDATIGSRLKLKDPYFDDNGGIGAELYMEDYGHFRVLAHNSRIIDIETRGNINIEAGTSVDIKGKYLRWNQKVLLTEEDLGSIEQRINDIENRLSKLDV